jgi:acyl carrier protein
MHYLLFSFARVEGRTYHVKPEDLVKKRIVFHLRHVAKIKNADVDLDKPLKEMGIDSITSMEMLMDIEREFNVSIPDAQIEQMVTARAMINLVRTLVALHV